jgi:hypothetical protein
VAVGRGGLNPVGPLQRLEDEGGAPLRACLLAVEETVPPQLRHHPDTYRQPRVERVHERGVVQQVADVESQLPGSGGHLELEG